MMMRAIFLVTASFHCVQINAFVIPQKELRVRIRVPPSSSSLFQNDPTKSTNTPAELDSFDAVDDPIELMGRSLQKYFTFPLDTCKL